VADLHPGPPRRKITNYGWSNSRPDAIATRAGVSLYYNDHRPHRSLGQAAPLRPLPDRTRTRINNIRRRDRLGGLLHEYQQVA
jgi:hypothetical protein